ESLERVEVALGGFCFAGGHGSLPLLKLAAVPPGYWAYRLAQGSYRLDYCAMQHLFALHNKIPPPRLPM
ncbi:MAG: hypothetical protein ACTSU0_07125, partial [Alphaproteobacteria bacterium]